MEAILLVGGQGTRLRPLTENVPKPMLQVAGIPCTEHQIAKVREAGATRVILATSYLAEVFEPYFGDGSAFGVELIYAVEDLPLGTGGAIANAGAHLISADAEPVIILNGDILSGHDLNAQCALHRERNADVTLHLTRVEDARNFGCVPVDDAGRVTAFLEKMEDPITNLINAGCYTFSAATVRSLPRDRVVSVERETFPDLLASNGRVFGFIDTSYWLDLGTPHAYLTGSCDLVTGKFASPAHTHAAADHLLLADAVVSVDVSLTGGTCIGERTRIDAGARLDAAVVLADAQIGAGARITQSIIGRGARIGAGALIEGPGTCLGDGVEVVAGAHIGPGNLISR